MKTFSLNNVSADYAERIMQEMKSNMGYIVFFNKGSTPEACHRIFYRALRTEKPEYDNLGPYIRKLARTVMKERTRDIPYSEYNEDGEVAFVFTSLTETPDLYAFDRKNQIMSTLQELYLRFPNEFMEFKNLVPTAEPDDVAPTLKECKELKRAIFDLASEFDGSIVLHCIYEFMTDLCKEKAEAINSALEKTVQLKKPDIRWLEHLNRQKWLLDADGNAYGINPRTLQMDDYFNPEFCRFRLSQSTACRIWRVDCSGYYNMIENKVYVEDGVDNEYIHWCGKKYSLTTPSGTLYVGIDREKYMEIVRQELIMNILNSGIGTVIAVSPDNIYIKLTKATALSMIKIKTHTGKVFTLPVELQQVEYVK